MNSPNPNAMGCIVVDITSPRRVLGDVSPNIKTTAVFANNNNNNVKQQSTSPLKRNFHSMTGDDTAGFTYLKRRKLSIDGSISDNNQVLAPKARRVFREDDNDDSMRFRPVTDRDETSVPVPTIREPTPTEIDTPSDHSDNPSSSQDRKSFSSLINYDPASQPKKPEPTSRAELLRMKLKVAMYKVKTNQIDVPLSDLRVDRPDSSQTSTAKAVEAAVAQLRREAQEVALRDQRRRAARGTSEEKPSLKLLPAPVLRPTAYSSCKIYPTTHNDDASPTTSPARAPRPSHAIDRFASPRQSIETHSNQYDMETELTSSVVKGRVAEGLLGLRNGV